MACPFAVNAQPASRSASGPHEHHELVAAAPLYLKRNSHGEFIFEDVVRNQPAHNNF